MLLVNAAAATTTPVLGVSMAVVASCRELEKPLCASANLRFRVDACLLAGLALMRAEAELVPTLASAEALPAVDAPVAALLAISDTGSIGIKSRRICYHVALTHNCNLMYSIENMDFSLSAQNIWTLRFPPGKSNARAFNQ